MRLIARVVQTIIIPPPLQQHTQVDTEDSGLVEREDFVKTIKNLRVGFGDLEIQSLLASCATAGTAPLTLNCYCIKHVMNMEYIYLYSAV